MFSTADLKALDPKYFSVIAVDNYDVTIIPHSYHQHWKANTLRKAVKSIKKHDWQQMGGKIKLL